MIHILFTFCDKKLADGVFEYHLARLPDTMCQRIKKYRRWQDAHCGLFGKILLIEGLKKYGIGDKQLEEMLYTSYSRPYLRAGVDFNISHSGTGVVCALSENCTVGIDIEEIKPLDINDFTRQFTDRELSLIHEAEDTYCEFYRWWTRKEAIIKADGKGLNIPLKEINFPDEGMAEVNDRSWQIREIPIRDQYCCHLAFAGDPDMPLTVKQYIINHPVGR